MFKICHGTQAQAEDTVLSTTQKRGNTEVVAEVAADFITLFKLA
jgi:hypothetical protein